MGTFYFVKCTLAGRGKMVEEAPSHVVLSEDSPSASPSEGGQERGERKTVSALDFLLNLKREVEEGTVPFPLVLFAEHVEFRIGNVYIAQQPSQPPASPRGAPRGNRGESPSPQKGEVKEAASSSQHYEEGRPMYLKTALKKFHGDKQYLLKTMLKYKGGIVKKDGKTLVYTRNAPKGAITDKKELQKILDESD